MCAVVDQKRVRISHDASVSQGQQMLFHLVNMLKRLGMETAEVVCDALVKRIGPVADAVVHRSEDLVECQVLVQG